MKTILTTTALTLMLAMPAFAQSGSDLTCADFLALDEAGQMAAVEALHSGDMMADDMPADDMAADDMAADDMGADDMAADATVASVTAACADAPESMISDTM
ncbi:hypothetical protein GCM10007908_28930 [Rhizobium albus]|nr:hypothetical protein GCM10007908_28930 [Rhizobium albus]